MGMLLGTFTRTGINMTKTKGTLLSDPWENTETFGRYIMVRVGLYNLDPNAANFLFRYILTDSVDNSLSLPTEELVAKPSDDLTQMGYQMKPVFLGPGETCSPSVNSDNGSDLVVDAEVDIIEVSYSNDILQVGGTTPVLKATVDDIKTQTDQLEFSSVDPSSGKGEVTSILSSTGLDNISTTEPTGRASTFREMVVQLYMRFFNKVDKTSNQIRVYDENNNIVTTQTHTTNADVSVVNRTS